MADSVRALQPQGRWFESGGCFARGPVAAGRPGTPDRRRQPSGRRDHSRAEAGRLDPKESRSGWIKIGEHPRPRMRPAENTRIRFLVSAVSAGLTAPRRLFTQVTSFRCECWPAPARPSLAADWPLLRRSLRSADSSLLGGYPLPTPRRCGARCWPTCELRPRL